MVKIDEIFSLNDFRQALNESKEPARPYNKVSTNIYRPDTARFKLVIWYKDGNRRYYYSYDNQYYNKVKHTDEYSSMVKLLKLIMKQKDSIHNAIIYATLEKDKPVNGNYNVNISWLNIKGYHSENKAVSFINDGKNSYLDLDRLKLYSDPNLIGK
jgi:hypothetical protein